MSILKLENVCKYYGVLRHSITYTLSRGKLGARPYGPNGSGKTTTFNVISGAQPLTSGQIFYNDVDITNMTSVEITKLGISRTFQMPRVLTRMSCLENVMTGAYCRTKTDLLSTLFHIPFVQSRQEKEISGRAKELLEFVGLKGSEDRWAGDLVWRNNSFCKSRDRLPPNLK
jgi:branched-chain amino acid transport system ATP-binding protein